MIYFCVFFFFQAEDGIRDRTVTGVQTCALPISRPGRAVRTAVPAAVPGRGSPGDAVTSEARERLPRASALRDRGCLRSRDRHEDVLRLGPGELLDHEVMRSHRIHEVPGRLGLRRRRSVAAILEARGPEISCRAV